MHLQAIALLVQAFLPAPATSAEVNSSVGVYYFSSDEQKMAAAQVERAEAGQEFPAPRDPRDVARDFARAELTNGNVCLTQAEHDLKDAMRAKTIAKMCRAIYKGELAEVSARAREEKQRVLSVSCEASAEARETPGSIRVVLSFRASAKIGERVPEKLARAGLKNEPASWELTPFEAPIGEGQGWKGILKNRACSLDSEALDKHFEAFLKQAREERAFARCRALQADDGARLARMQEKFRQYVPDEWMKDAAGDDLPGLLTPAPGPESSRTLEACRKARENTAEKLEELADLSGSIARKHDVPALKPAAPEEGSRKPASAAPEEKETE